IVVCCWASISLSRSEKRQPSSEASTRPTVLFPVAIKPTRKSPGVRFSVRSTHMIVAAFIPFPDNKEYGFEAASDFPAAVGAVARNAAPSSYLRRQIQRNDGRRS